MIVKLIKYFSFIFIYLYFIIVGFELVSIENNHFTTNRGYYTYIKYINILYIIIVCFCCYKIIELLYEYKCSYTIYLKENDAKYIENEGCTCLVFIYCLMLIDLMMYFFYVVLSVDYIENYKEDFMELPLYRLYYYPKLIMSIVFNTIFIIILLNLSFLCIDGFFFNSNIHKYIDKKKQHIKLSPIRKRRNRISITNDIT